jgi:hypothetical protein
MGIIDDPNLKIWSETKEKLSYFGNSGQTGGNLWQGCLTTSPTEPSSLVRESGIRTKGFLSAVTALVLRVTKKGSCLQLATPSSSSTF